MGVNRDLRLVEPVKSRFVAACAVDFIAFVDCEHWLESGELEDGHSFFGA